MQTSLLTIAPRIQHRGAGLVAETSLAGYFAGLTLLRKRVEVDPKAGVFRLSRRTLWFFESNREIRFDEVRRITYKYSDLKLFQSRHVHDPLDCYTVGLELMNGEELRLFRFIGDGAAYNAGYLPDWCHFRDLTFDASGTQERESRIFVQALEEITGIALVA